MIQQKDLNNLIKNIKGKIRGVVFQTDAEYVRTKEGEAGLEKLQQKADELGLGIDYKGAKAMEWYPVGSRIASLLLIKDLFGWTEEDIKEMGQAAPKTSFIVKLFFKLFLSPQRLAKEVPRYWRKHYTRGELKVISLDEKKKELVLRLEDYPLHPLFCKYLEGYFATTMALTRKSREAQAKETKCPHRDKTTYHEYLVTWK